MTVAPPEKGEPWTVLRMIRWSAAYLEEKGVEGGRLDAEHLLAETLHTNRLGLYLEFDRPLIPVELSTYREMLKRRGRREPLQYILGKAAFRELELEVDRRALIPRPETEELVGLVLAWAAEPENAPAARGWDVGTGSGAIALALLDEGDFAAMVASDISQDALDLAAANARRCGVADRLEFRGGSLLDVLSEGERFDVLVANLPYVPEGDRGEIAPEVRDWEPEQALFGGPEGMDAIDRLIAGAPTALRGGGLLALEVGAGQAENVRAIIEASGDYRGVRVARDMADRDRFVLAETNLSDGPVKDGRG
jgi:release factor glutamine methyltransferase